MCIITKNIYIGIYIEAINYPKANIHEKYPVLWSLQKFVISKNEKPFLFANNELKDTRGKRDEMYIYIDIDKYLWIYGFNEKENGKQTKENYCCWKVYWQLICCVSCKSFFGNTQISMFMFLIFMLEEHSIETSKVL